MNSVQYEFFQWGNIGCYYVGYWGTDVYGHKTWRNTEGPIDYKTLRQKYPNAKSGGPYLD